MNTSYASPLEHCFGYNHPTFYSNGFYGDQLDTNASAQEIHNSLNNYGYYNQYWYTNNSAQSLQNTIGNDAIFYVFAHGAAGKISCATKDSNGIWNYTFLTAKKTSYSTAYSLEAKYANTTNKLKKVRLAYFNSCESAVSDTYWNYGNLLDMAHNLGVDAAKADTLRQYGDYGDVDTVKLVGNANVYNVKLIPAAYGSY